MNEEELNAIKERLAKASPGPWKLIRNAQLINGIESAEEISWKDWKGFADVIRLDQSGDGCELDIKDEDADLIANAPTDLAACVEEIERLTRLEVPPMKDTGRDCIWESLPGHDGDWCTAHDLSRYACQAREIAHLTEALVEERETTINLRGIAEGFHFPPGSKERMERGEISWLGLLSEMASEQLKSERKL